MTSFIRPFLLLPVLILLTLQVACSTEKKVELIYLTWEHEDLSHTMTVNYLTNKLSTRSQVYFDTVSQKGEPENYRFMEYGILRTYPDVKFSVHSIQLADLDPDETYYFVVGNEDSGFSDERKFRTVPENGSIRFISGGDTTTSKTFEEICKIAASSDPHFSIIGGDIAYDNGDIDSQQLWLDLLDIWQRTMISPDGYTIPVIAAIGNHEVNTLNRSSFDKAPFYHLIFNPANNKTFFKRHIGNYATLFVLDTDHSYSSAGEQLDWMNKNFAEHKNKNFIFASYHVPLYPSFRSPDASPSVLLRNNWLPVFDRYALDVAFENHEHTLKKSRRLKNNKVTQAQGTVYIGDGNWGAYSRKPKEHWYLEATRRVNHVWQITLDEQSATFEALTIDGTDEEFSFKIQSSRQSGD